MVTVCAALLALGLALSEPPPGSQAEALRVAITSDSLDAFMAVVSMDPKTEEARRAYQLAAGLGLRQVAVRTVRHTRPAKFEVTNKTKWPVLVVDQLLGPDERVEIPGAGISALPVLPDAADRYERLIAAMDAEAAWAFQERYPHSPLWPALTARMAGWPIRLPVLLMYEPQTNQPRFLRIRLSKDGTLRRIRGRALASLVAACLLCTDAHASGGGSWCCSKGDASLLSTSESSTDSTTDATAKSWAVTLGVALGISAVGALVYSSVRSSRRRKRPSRASLAMASFLRLHAFCRSAGEAAAAEPTANETLLMALRLLRAGKTESACHHYHLAANAGVGSRARRILSERCDGPEGTP